jgi:hypothetical protein
MKISQVFTTLVLAGSALGAAMPNPFGMQSSNITIGKRQMKD